MNGEELPSPYLTPSGYDLGPGGGGEPGYDLGPARGGEPGYDLGPGRGDRSGYASSRYPDGGPRPGDPTPGAAAGYQEAGGTYQAGAGPRRAGDNTDTGGGSGYREGGSAGTAGAQPQTRRALRNSGQTPMRGGSATGGIPALGGTTPSGQLPLGPGTGSIALGPGTGSIRVERLQADRLVSDRPRGDTGERDLPDSFPDAVRIAALGSGVSLSGDRPATRHRNRKGNRTERKPPRADRVLLVYLSVVLLILVGLGAGGAWLMLGPLHKGSGSSGAVTDRILLVGLTDGSNLVSSAVLGTGGGSSCVLLPPSLLVTRGEQRVPLSDALADGPAGPAQALAATLNVPIDGSWLVNLRGLTSLVDGGGGVVVDVDQEIRSDTGTVLVGAGTGQRLTGAQATAFVTAKRGGDDAQALGRRFATVLGQVLAGLPAGATDTAKDLSAVGTNATSSLSPASLAGVLARIGQAVSDTGGQLSVTQLPVVASGADQPGGVVADPTVAGNLIRQQLGAAPGSSTTG